MTKQTARDKRCFPDMRWLNGTNIFNTVYVLFLSLSQVIIHIGGKWPWKVAILEATPGHCSNIGFLQVWCFDRVVTGNKTHSIFLNWTISKACTSNMEFHNSTQAKTKTDMYWIYSWVKMSKSWWWRLPPGWGLIDMWGVTETFIICCT